jgi:hypothetical protein
MNKQNKIKVAVDPDYEVRRKILQKIAVECGFALTAGDAGKIIKPSPYECNMPGAFFVLAELHNFRTSPIMNQHLYEMAARGMAVIVGIKKLPREFEFLCEPYYSNYL